MSDEQEMKLACLHQAGGNLDHAKDLFAWVSGRDAPSPDADFESGFYCGLKDSPTCPGTPSGMRGWKHGDALRKRVSELEARLRTRGEDGEGVSDHADAIQRSETISALTPPLQHKGGETEAGAFDDGEAMRAASTLPSGARYKTDEEIRASFRAAEPDRLAEFMKRPGAVEHDGVLAYDMMHNAAEVEVLHRNGDVERALMCTLVGWRHDPTEDSALDIIAHRIISSSEADSGPGSEAIAGDARIEQTISTLQASSGEGETLPSMDDIIDPDFTGGLLTEEYLERLHKGTLGAVDEFLTSIMERGGTWHDGGNNPAPNWFVDIYVPAASTNLGDKPQHLEGQPSNAYIWGGWECAYVRTKPMQLDGPLTSALRLDEPADTPPEPAAYSPVNNADEPVTKPEADVFSHGLQAEAEAKKEEPRKFGIFGEIKKFGRS